MDKKKKQPKEMEDLSFRDLKNLKLREWIMFGSAVVFIAAVGGYIYYLMNYSHGGATDTRPENTTNNIHVQQAPVQVNKMDSSKNGVQVNSTGNSKIVIQTPK